MQKQVGSFQRGLLFGSPAGFHVALSSTAWVPIHHQPQWAMALGTNPSRMASCTLSLPPGTALAPWWDHNDPSSFQTWGLLQWNSSFPSQPLTYKGFMFSVFHEVLPWQTLVCELPGKQEVLFPDVPAAHFVVLNLGHRLLLWKLYIAQLQDKESWVRGQHTNYTKKLMVYQNDWVSFQTREQNALSLHSLVNSWVVGTGCKCCYSDG